MGLYDTVYYWLGGTENGEWRQVVCVNQDLNSIVAEIERGGRVAVKGSTRIGAPEGQPQRRS